MELEEIYKAYFQDVYRYIRRLSGSGQIAEEITSETFLKAVRAASGFRGECEFRVWLCQIAKNCYYSYQKKNRRIQSLEEDGLQNLADPNGSVEETVSRREEAEALRRLLHTLPEPYREVVMWRAFAGLDFKQIGALFHKSDNWACVTYHRARKMLRSRWEENEVEE